ncbi:unnamed protein product [Vitrella brassicaformis CCMP3155]|uniref:Importin subunit alpha n=2 Tax=Vitrella brassicaformis TaxID=1169539 RepID=A0A0G4GHB6_VITBC|nr:unnamed protein product [Vitrella brassicaformis CCMP3155]|eukprot:CEM29132.1 unnamed protein product [Vitrella brassicaformis CCMP3155]
MASAGSTADAVGTTVDNPSLQAVLAKASDLVHAIHTKEAYDHAVKQRGSEAVEADIAAVMTDICNMMASASDPQLRAEAMRQLAGLLSIEHIEGIGQKAVDVGLVPVLVEQLSGCEDLQAAAGQALSMLAIQNGDAVVNADAVPPLVQLVSSPDDDVRGGGIATLCNITAGSAACRDVVVAAGIVEPLLKAMRESSNAAVLTVSACLLRNLWIVPENAPLPAPLAELAPFVPVLVGLVAAPQQDDRVLKAARVALQHLIHRLHGQGTDADRDALVECGAVASIKPLVQMADLEMKGPALLMVYFVAEGTTSHVQTVIDGGLVPLLVDLAANAESDSGLKEIAVGNILLIVVKGSQRQIEYVVECGGIRPLCDLLDGADGQIRDGQIRDIISALHRILNAGRQKQATEGLPNNPYSTLLEQAAGVDKLVELQTHNNMDIALRAVLCSFIHLPDRVDEQRLEALIQAGVIQVVNEQGGDEDDRATHVSDSSSSGSDSDSDGQGEGEGEGDTEEG